MYWLLAILLILVIYFIFFVSQFFNIFFKGYAPFISTDRQTIRKMLADIKLPSLPLIYELGCGRARFLKMAEKEFSAASLIGVENLFSLYLINKIKFRLLGSRIKLLKKDFFEFNLENADLIYCYLNNATMAKLGEKFRHECRVGTQIISRSFPIPQFRPEKTLLIKNKKIYFYRIS
jgi:hypothetical protein